MSNSIIILPVILIILALLIALQIFLSMQKSKWLGLYIPVLGILLAAFASFGSMVYTGEITPIIIIFIISSVPAIISLLIYLACRAKVKDKNQKELEKMNIQDLD